ncbi:multicopper oxidase family protein [Tundrisphaera sp. TA3]|uniref:multicopper oxidase family protein n=1 Tax=Tundrisphaera sp. TA3 TaxID=3435775 RepID=UPI003EBC373B
MAGTTDPARAEGGNRARCEAREFIQPWQVDEEDRWKRFLPLPGDVGGSATDKPAPGTAPMYRIKPRGYIHRDDIRRAVAKARARVEAEGIDTTDIRVWIHALGEQGYPRVDTLRPNPDGSGVPMPLDPPVGMVEHGIAPEFWGRVGNFSPEEFWEVHATIPFYEVHVREFRAQVLPPVKIGGAKRDLKTTLWGYDAQVPGPTFVTDSLRPVVVRFHDDLHDEKDPERLHAELSVHLHGAHTPSHSDGHPAFLICPGQARDYYYPVGVPKRAGADPMGRGEWDMTEAPSTMWYHDHANDITAHNALMGLAGFWLISDELEKRLVHGEKESDGTVKAPPLLPGPDQDIPIALADRCFCQDGRLHFDPFDHNGYLGNFVLCNGVAFPKLEVEPRKYRFRFLDASLARMYRLEFRRESDLTSEARGEGDRQAPKPDRTRPISHLDPEDPDRAIPFCRIGKDSWLYPNPLPDQRSIFLGMANRADIVVDFKEYAGQTLYLVNTLEQRDGRGPGHGDNEEDGTNPRGDNDHPPLMKRRTSGGPGAGEVGPDHGSGKDDLDDYAVVRLIRIEVKPGVVDDPCRFDPTIEMRRHEDLRFRLSRQMTDEEIDALPVREFDFERRKGAWQINHRFFDEEVADAVPSLDGPDGGLERWILRNRSGGWWHPIHLHLESHQHIRQYHSRGGEDGVVKVDVRSIPPEDRFKHDTTVLGPNLTVEMLMRFRTFYGPFVFHCHNLNHEDMRMMATIDPRHEGSQSPLPIRPEQWFGEPLGTEPCAEEGGKA